MRRNPHSGKYTRKGPGVKSTNGKARRGKRKAVAK